MTHIRTMFGLLLVALLAAPAPLLARNPNAQDKENYERLIEIIFAGTADNKTMAKDTLRQMGEVAIKLLKEDCKDTTSIRGAFAWGLLKDFVGESNPDVLRQFARKELVNTAKEWNKTYTEKRSKSKKPERLKQVVDDYVALLITSPKEKDFDLLLKALKYSLITVNPKVDFGAEFEVWQKIWIHLGDKIRASENLRDIHAWQKVVDGHFRAYSQRKAYINSKAIGVYHTTTLRFIHRMNQLREDQRFRKDAAKKPDAETPKPD